MKEEWKLTAESFNLLLAWLDADDERAGQKYEHIRGGLIAIFRARACVAAEELADETINRVTRRVPELLPTYVGDPALYFYTVAHRLHLEYLQKHPLQSPPAQEPVANPVVEETEHDYACLEECLQKLPAEQRELILQYYQEDKQAKIDQRKVLADRLGIGLNALRIRAHRIRVDLHTCLNECLKRQMGWAS